MYQLIFMGGAGVGLGGVGVLARATSSSASLLVSMALLLLCGLSSQWCPSHVSTNNLDLTPSSH